MHILLPQTHQVLSVCRLTLCQSVIAEQKYVETNGIRLVICLDIHQEDNEDQNRVFHPAEAHQLYLVVTILSNP